MEGEISLLLDEEASTLFPLEHLAVCPLKWTAIKLCGRRFDFHETGCVCAMSKVRAAAAPPGVHKCLSVMLPACLWG